MHAGSIPARASTHIPGCVVWQAAVESDAEGAVLAALLRASCLDASPPPAITIDSASARPTAPGQSATAAYFTITSAGGGDRLIAISSPIGQAWLHSTMMDGGVTRMRPLDALDIPARSTTALEPGAIQPHEQDGPALDKLERLIA